MTHDRFQLENWTAADYQQLVQYLHELADPAYQQFHQKLIPGVEGFLGVRVPVLRSLAREIAKGDRQGYFAQVRPGSYEEIMLYGLVIGQIRDDLAAAIQQLDRFVPMIDNWAVCDVCCAGLKLAARRREEMRAYLQQYLDSAEEFQLRFGLVMLMDYYIDPVYIDEVLAIYGAVRHEGYYVKMAVAWGISVCFVKFREKALALLQSGMLEPETCRKALQKILESTRVSAADKELIRALRKNISAPKECRTL